MYYYVYDSFLDDKKYQPLLHKIETRLMDLGISGRTEKLTILKSFKEIVRSATSKGVDTLVAVGNDETFSKIISFLSDHSIILGMIPIGPNNTIASMLGIPQGESACNVLSARIVEKLDLGKANDAYFISSLEIPTERDVIMDCGGYNISPLSTTNSISIRNFGSLNNTTMGRKKISSPTDGILEAVISSKKRRSGFFKRQTQFTDDSVFPFKKIKIKCNRESLPIVADGQTTIKTPVTVEVLPKKLKVIVGKNRMF